MVATMRRTKAHFKALRERVGLSQSDIAIALGVNIKTVKRWEQPQFPYSAPSDAWNYLDSVLAIQEQQVQYSLDAIAEQVEEFGREPKTVTITYYRDQAMYDEYGRDSGPYGWANAIARATAVELDRRGINYDFRYPTD